MPKTCAYPGCNDKCWGGNYCKRPQHQSSRQDSQYLRRIAKQEEKKKDPKKAIRKIATKRKSQRNEYNELRKEFFEKPENHRCVVYPELEATDIHHSWGTENERLLLVKYWLPVSRPGHKYIDDHPEEAYQRGWNLYRNQNPET